MASGASKGAMTKIFTYSRTMKSTSDYATNMKRLSAQIFGEVGQTIIKINDFSFCILEESN